MKQNGIWIESVSQIALRSNDTCQYPIETSVILRDYFEYLFQGIMLEGKTNFGNEFNSEWIQWYSQLM
jgi:hypothetical protein